MLKLENYKSTIAIARTDAIGDCVMTLPICGILKKYFPLSKIVFIASTYTKSIIESDTNIDEFIDWTLLKAKTQAEQIEFLRQTQIDCLIFAFPNKELAKISKRANIPIRIATSHRIYNWLYCNRLVNFSRKNSSLNEAQLNTKLLKPLSITEDYTLEQLADFIAFKPKETDCKYKEFLSKDTFNIILHPKSRGSGREWPQEYYQNLINLLDHRFRIFICGREKEMEGVSFQGDNVINLVGKMSLEQYIDFIAHSDMLIACSTGPLHIAAISSIHAVGLYPPKKNIDPQRWYPLGKKVKIFCYDKPNCEQCKKTTSCQCMLKITPQEVAEYIFDVNNLK